MMAPELRQTAYPWQIAIRVAVWLGLGLILSGGALPSAEAVGPKARSAPGRILAKFKPSTALQQSDAVHAQMGGKKIHASSLVPGLQVVAVSRGLEADMAEAYARLPEIEYAEPDYLQYATREPNDPQFLQQWALKNTGQTGGTVGADISAPAAWEITTGSSGVIVMVIDSGIDYNHLDLTANMWRNPGEIPGNGIDDDGDGWVDNVYGIDPRNNDGDPLDDNGHGTHVVGTIGSVGTNAQGVTGVNWNVQLMACKFLVANGSGPTSAAIQCLQYAVSKGVHLTNNSWGGGGYSQALYDAIRAAGAAGQLFVAAAGNDGSDNDANPHYPSSYDLSNILAVASTDKNDLRSGLSNFGVSSVHIVAPGSSILSTLRGGGYGLMSGTSMATPHATGVAALILAQNPGLSPQEVKQRMLMGGDPVASLMGRTSTGQRLNAHRPLTLSSAPSVALTLTGCTATCRPGDTFSASATVTNPTAQQARVELKAGVRLPDGTALALSALAPDFLFTLEAGQSLSGILLSTAIPSGIPPGRYRYEVALVDPELGVTFFREARVFVVVQPGRAPSNDLRANASVIEGIPFSDLVDTRTATTTPDDPVHSCTSSQDSTSVWYKFTAPSTGFITVNTFNSDYDTVLTAYNGTPGPSTEIACNDDTGGTQSEIGFLAIGGTTYWIEVAGYGTSPGGTLFLSMPAGEQLAPPQLTLAFGGCSACRPGDRFTVNATLSNPSSATIPVEIKFGVRFPDGTPLNIWAVPDPQFRFSVPPGSLGPVTVTDTVIPAGLPTGTWTYEGILLDPELGTPMSRSVRPFSVSP